MRKVIAPNMMAEINITPLVDVMLVLLVIFILVTPSITNSISQTIERSVKAEEMKPHKLIVQAGDTYLLDGQFIGQTELKQHFKQALKDDANYTVQIFGEPDASYQGFTRIMAIANNAGVKNLSLASN